MRDFLGCGLRFCRRYMKISTPLTIALGVIAAILVSFYWRFSGGNFGFNNLNPQIPELKQLNLPNFNLPGMVSDDGSYKNFNSASNDLTFKYRASFQGGENLFGQEGIDKLKSINNLLFAYRVSLPDLQPSYLVVSQSDDAPTESIAEQAKNFLGQQQCAVEIKNAASTNEMISEILDASYECAGAQKGYEQWHAQTAIVKKQTGFYSVSMITTAKNWPALQPEAQAIFDSIKIP